MSVKEAACLTAALCVVFILGIILDVHEEHHLADHPLHIPFLSLPSRFHTYSLRACVAVSQRIILYVKI